MMKLKKKKLPKYFLIGAIPGAPHAKCADFGAHKLTNTTPTFEALLQDTLRSALSIYRAVLTFSSVVVE